MIKYLLMALLAAGSIEASLAQSIDSLKLTDAELPSGYTGSDQLICLTPHGCSVYEQGDMYEALMGKIKRKDFQAFQKKGDKGSILYFEFEKDFTAQSFLNGLLWGNGGKPTKSEPDEYYAKGNILVIWSLDLKSQLKAISREKIMRLLH